MYVSDIVLICSFFSSSCVLNAFLSREAARMACVREASPWAFASWPEDRIQDAHRALGQGLGAEGLDSRGALVQRRCLDGLVQGTCRGVVDHVGWYCAAEA